MKVFQAAAIAEAVSWAGLLAGMFVKYLGSGNEIGVQIFGPVHGVLFMVYVASVLVVCRNHFPSVKELAIGLACSIPPFFTLYFDRRVMRRWKSEPQEAKVS